MFGTLPSLDTTFSDEMQCYVHSLSPVKKAASSDKQYFHCMLQTQNKSVRAVCFSPEKHGKFRSSELNKSPVKLQNLKPPPNNGQDLVLNRFTKITPLARDEVAFKYSDELTPKSQVTDISSLTKIAKEQIVSVKAELAQVSGIEVVVTQDNSQLRKQELVIRDGKSSIQLVLWDSYVDSLEINKTYLFNNLRLKESKFGRYLNTAKSEKFTFEETTPFTQPLVDIEDDVQQMTTSTVFAKIIGVQSATRNLLCVSQGSK